DSERVAGGSSGGSAVSVATGMCLGSVGTDTRGSIRIPSAFCGVVGLKPTRGRVPLDGVLPLSWTLDHAGPIAGTVGDVALLFEVLSRRRRRKAPPAGKAARLRIGICDYYWRDLDREVERPLKSALRRFESWGFEVHPIGIQNIDEALEASRVLAAADALAVHREYIRTKADCYVFNDNYF
ncbi:MAG: amidase family protein, partial [Acidobacteriota bacterium]